MAETVVKEKGVSVALARAPTLHDSVPSDAVLGDDEPRLYGGGWIMTQEPSELIEADAEPGLGEVSVCFAGGGLAARQDRGGLGSPGDREGDEAEEQVELAGGDEPGVLEVEAAGLGVAEEAFDGPALAVSREGCLLYTSPSPRD